MKNELVQIQPMQLIQNAVDKGLAIENLERLLTLQERYEKNQAEKAFNEAMQLFQGKKPVITKTKKGHNSNYAPLPKIQQLVDPILSECGLSYSWKQSGENGIIKITCILNHVLGHKIETSIEAGSDTSGSKNAIQAIGSTISYLKRYTLENVLGLSADEDNDGASHVDLADVKKHKLLSELCVLYIMKKKNIPEDRLVRLEEIIIEQEWQSIPKAIETLKTF